MDQSQTERGKFRPALKAVFSSENFSSKNREARIAAVGQMVLVGLVGGVFFAHGMNYVNHGLMTTFEASFPVAALRAIDGQIPYRDFAFIEMPLALYLRGLMSFAVGSSIIAGRYINLFVTLFALVGLVIVLRRRFGRWEPGLAAAFASVCSPHWVSAMVQGTTAPLAMCFLVIAFGAAILRGRDRVRTALFALGMGAAIITSLQAIPLAAGLWIVALLGASGMKQRLWLVAASLISIAAALGNWFLIAGWRFEFFNWTFVGESELSRHVILLLSETWKVSPGAILGCLSGLVASPLLLRRRFTLEQCLLLVCFLSMVVPLLSNNAYGKDIAPVVPFVAASGIVAVWRLDIGTRSPFRFAYWIFPLIGLLYPFPERIAEKPDLEIEETADALREMAPAGPVLTPLPIVALTASRDIYPGTDLGMLSVLSPKYQSYADELHMTTLDSLTDAIERRQPAAIVLIRGSSRGNFNFGVPDMHPQPGAHIRGFNRALHQNYFKVHQTRTLDAYIAK